MRAAVLALAVLPLLACEEGRRPGGVSPTNNQPRPDATPGDGDAEGGDGSGAEDARAEQDAGLTGFPDAFTSFPDAFTGFPDAFTGFPDAFTGFPDAFTGFPDAQPPPPFDAGARDAGAARDASVSLDPCGELAPCCSGVVLILLPDCATTASSGDRNACQMSLDSLAAFGACGPTPDAGARPDAAPPSDASSPPGTCADLAACCSALADPSQCQLLASSGIDLLCDAFLGTLAGLCPP